VDVWRINFLETIQAENNLNRNRYESTVSILNKDLKSSQSSDLIEVAVGILIRHNGDFLMTSRPLGKEYQNYWEFPGGKLENGETVAEALRRELIEEIGLAIESPQPWRSEIFSYPHALVRLHFCKVWQWQGDLQMREEQSYSWERIPVGVSPILPGTLPVLEWLDQERKSNLSGF